MMIDHLWKLFCACPVQPEDLALDAEFEPVREELRLAGLDEEALRQMDPDDRVAALEQAELDPYDYILRTHAPSYLGRADELY